MENKIQSQVAALQLAQVAAGISPHQIARNVYPMHELIQRAIWALQGETRFTGEDWHGATKREICAWLTSQGFRVDKGYVNSQCTMLERDGFIKAWEVTNRNGRKLPYLHYTLVP